MLRSSWWEVWGAFQLHVEVIVFIMLRSSWWEVWGACLRAACRGHRVHHVEVIMVGGLGGLRAACRGHRVHHVEVIMFIMLRSSWWEVWGACLRAACRGHR